MSWETLKQDIETAIMRRAAKTDGNQTNVVSALRKAGLSVAITSSLGNGFPDLVVSSKFISRYNFPDIQRTVLIELKDPSKPPSARKLTPDEQKFHDAWRGEIYTCTTADEILKIFGLI